MDTNYVILVTIDEQTYVDGIYKIEELAKDVFEHWVETYPNLEFELVEVLNGFSIRDEIFMANNRGILDFGNTLAYIEDIDSEHKRTLQ